MTQIWIATHGHEVDRSLWEQGLHEGQSYFSPGEAVLERSHHVDSFTGTAGNWATENRMLGEEGERVWRAHHVLPLLRNLLS